LLSRSSFAFISLPTLSFSPTPLNLKSKTLFVFVSFHISGELNIATCLVLKKNWVLYCKIH
jgi:hypothetical protein